MKDTDLLLTMLINLSYLQVKTLAKLTEDHTTLEEATMIVNESKKLLEQMIKREDEDFQSEGLDIKINTESEPNTFKNKLWRLKK